MFSLKIHKLNDGVALLSVVNTQPCEDGISLHIVTQPIKYGVDLKDLMEMVLRGLKMVGYLEDR